MIYNHKAGFESKEMNYSCEYHLNTNFSHSLFSGFHLAFLTETISIHLKNPTRIIVLYRLKFKISHFMYSHEYSPLPSLMICSAEDHTLETMLHSPEKKHSIVFKKIFKILKNFLFG